MGTFMFFFSSTGSPGAQEVQARPYSEFGVAPCKTMCFLFWHLVALRLFFGKNTIFHKHIFPTFSGSWPFCFAPSQGAILGPSRAPKMRPLGSEKIRYVVRVARFWKKKREDVETYVGLTKRFFFYEGAPQEKQQKREKQNIVRGGIFAKTAFWRPQKKLSKKLLKQLSSCLNICFNSCLHSCLNGPTYWIHPLHSACIRFVLPQSESSCKACSAFDLCVVMEII